jgi:hypothetical protein
LETYAAGFRNVWVSAAAFVVVATICTSVLSCSIQ